MRRVILFLGLPFSVLTTGALWFALSSPSGITGEIPTPTDKGTVLLIPGHGGDLTSLNGLSKALSADGYVVKKVDIGDGSGDINSYADRVVNLASDAPGPISLVGYSQGGLIARAAAQINPDLFGRIVTIATPHAGTQVAALAAAFKVNCDLSCRQMVPGSDFLRGLTLPAVADRWLALYTSGDQVVLPVEAAALPGATNIDLKRKCQVPLDHYKIVTARESAAAVSDFLASGREPSTC